jgi:hypothetical protein
MFIVWGKKHVYRKVGYVADFCPMCRSIKGFLLRRVGLAGHIYYISLSDGALIGHQRTCEDCKTIFNANADKYASVSKKAASLDDLQRQTYPTLKLVIAERLALEEKVKNTPASLSTSERRELIYAPFLLLSPKIEKQYASIQVDKEIGFSLAGVIIFFMIVPEIVQENFSNHADESLLIFGAISLILLIWQFMTAGRRFMRRQIIPVLSKAISPLHPTQAEIDSILGDMRQKKHKMGTKLKLGDLAAHLQSLSVAS